MTLYNKNYNKKKKSINNSKIANGTPTVPKIVIDSSVNSLNI